MADFGIKYGCVITPTETITLEDGTTEKTFIHSDIDSRFGGKTEKSVGTGSENIATITKPITTSSQSLNVLSGKTLTNVSLLYVEILSSDDELGGTPRCSISSSGITLSRLSGVGDWVLLRPGSVLGNSLLFYSGGGSYDCTVRIVYALF